MSPDSAYLLSLAAALALGAACFALLARRAGAGLGRRLRALALALGLGLAGARLFYFAARASYLLPMYGWGRLLVPPPADMAMGGAVLGLLLAGRLAGGPGQGAHRWLDLLAPAALLTLTLARLGEYFVDFGQGGYVEDPAFQFFPLAVSNQWGEWYWAVFLLKALLAGLILPLSLMPGRPGARWQRALMLALLGLMLTDSLRADTLRWGFVRVHQLFSALSLAALLLGFLRGQGRAALPRALLFLLGVALIIGIEFALDKWLQMPDWALYILMCLTLCGMGLLIAEAARRGGRPLFGGRDNG